LTFSNYKLQDIDAPKQETMSVPIPFLFYNHICYLKWFTSLLFLFLYFHFGAVMTVGSSCHIDCGFTSTSNIGMTEYYFCWINLIDQTLGRFQLHTVKLSVNDPRIYKGSKICSPTLYSRCSLRY
jgi:hypothetical protein